MRRSLENTVHALNVQAATFDALRSPSIYRADAEGEADEVSG